MATSGTLSPGGGYQGRTLSMSWFLASQSVSGNYSVISWTLSAVGGSSSYYYHHKEQLYIYGAYRYNNKSSTKRYKGTIASGSITISHDSAGNASFSATIYGAIYTSSQNVSGSNSWSLPTIPRVSDLSLNKSSVPVDGSTTVTATATKKSSSFTDTITVTLGSYSQTVVSGTAFTIPKTWINAISGTSATAVVKVTTKSGSTVVGSKQVNLTITVPEDIKPSVSSITVAEAVSTVTAAFGNRFVRTLSQLNVSIDASGVYGSTIKSYATTIESVNYVGQAFNSNALNTSGTVDIKTTVTDSRGRTATLTKNITVVDYFSPTITDMTYYPCDSAGNQNSSGTYTKVLISGKIASVASQNTRSLVLKYKAATAETYTARTLTISDYTFSVETIIANTDPTVTYEYIAELTDKIGSTTFKISTGVPVISRHVGGDGITLFEDATDAGFKVGGKKSATFTGDILIDDLELEELWDSAFGGGLISQDFNTWYKGNIGNGTYTITEENGVSVLKLTAQTNYLGIYLPSAATPRKEELKKGIITFSIWIKKLIDGTVYPVQFRVMTEDTDGKNVAGGGYWTHGFASSYSNKPIVKIGEWTRYEVRFDWDTFISKATQYGTGFTADTATGLNIRLYGGSTTLLGDIAEYKLPKLTVE